MTRPTPEPTGPGRESVWDYPRPPRLEATTNAIRVEFDGRPIAESTRAFRVLETSHPPTYYVNPLDTELALLERTGGSSVCEWKGHASYFDLVAGDHRVERVAWWYASPLHPFEELAHHLAFYPSLVDCFVDDEPVKPQPGEFYGGWITDAVVGPFKGEPGSHGW